jgi:hypothetical protein
MMLIYCVILLNVFFLEKRRCFLDKYKAILFFFTAVRKKKFDGCLLHINTDDFIVPEWHQLVTTADKLKLTV